MITKIGFCWYWNDKWFMTSTTLPYFKGVTLSKPSHRVLVSATTACPYFFGGIRISHRKLKRNCWTSWYVQMTIQTFDKLRSPSQDRVSMLDFEGCIPPRWALHAKQQAHAFLRQADGSKGALQLAVPLQAAWLDHQLLAHKPWENTPIWLSHIFQIGWRQPQPWPCLVFSSPPCEITISRF